MIGLRAFAALSLFHLFLFALGPPGAAEEWSILEYDENGVAVGVRSGEDAPDYADGFGDARRYAVEPDEILLVNPPPEDLAQLTAQGFSILRSDTLEGLEFTLVLLRVPRSMSLPTALNMITESYPDVVVSANDLLDLNQGPSPLSRQIAQAGQDFTRNLTGWGSVPESCGAGITLGQIDGAVDLEHRALRGKKIIYSSLIKRDRIPAAVDHGTAVAILLIGRSINDRPGGLLPGAQLFAANIFEVRKGRSVGNLAALVRSVDWLVTKGVRVANLSVAGRENAIVRLAVNKAKQKGLLIVAAAGNNGLRAPPVWPAADPDTFAVTAIDRGLDLYRYANQGDYIDFAAPGVEIPTQTPRGLTPQSGTSFAAPFITAMVALHLKAGFEADPDLIRRSLIRYTKDLGAEGKDGQFGWGLVRLRPSC